MNKNTLLAAAVAATLVSAPSFAGYVCGSDNLSGYVRLTDFAPTGGTLLNPTFDGTFNATLRDLNGRVECQVPPSGNYGVEVSGAFELDLNTLDNVFTVNLAGSIVNPLSIFGGALNMTGITPGTYAFDFTPGAPGVPDNQVNNFGFSVAYDGEMPASTLALINTLLGTSLVNPDGAGTLAVSGVFGTDGMTMTFTESNLDWMGFEKLLFAADQKFGSSTYNWIDANFRLTDARVHIPEPASIALLGLGLLGLAAARRRRTV